jgi:hypothetical protein
MSKVCLAAGALYDFDIPDRNYQRWSLHNLEKYIILYYIFIYSYKILLLTKEFLAHHVIR